MYTKIKFISNEESVRNSLKVSEFILTVVEPNKRRVEFINLAENIAKEQGINYTKLLNSANKDREKEKQLVAIMAMAVDKMK
jgi:hypothetical protein